LILSLLFAVKSYGGPPFLTDDPEPVPYMNFEAYVFSTIDRTADNTAVQAPAFEFNMGVLTNLQLHLVVPLAYCSPADTHSTYGLGDIELGAKFRFVEETEHFPQIAIFPLIELPAGTASRGLGNGQTWGKIPLWLQKSWGPWTTYGGGGYAINQATRQRDYPFGGWLLQRDITERLTFGGEIFAQGKASGDGRAFTVFNLGGTYKFTPHFSLLFTGGHTLTGERHFIGYLGLYWTWGRK
jgi:hypothetical protein